MNNVESMKFKISYSRYLSELGKIETQLKQCYVKYHGQCNDDMKASLENDPGFKAAHKVKDIIKLRAILRTVTFHYRKSEEPIKTLWKANRDFMNLQQQRTNITDYYNKFTDMKNLVDEK